MEWSEADMRHECEKSLYFETLLAEISTQFINLPSEQIDSFIEEAQRRICNYLDLDLSALWQWSQESPRFLTLTHLYSMPGGPVRPQRIDAQEAFPWVLSKVLGGETLILSTEDMPPEAAQDQESRRHFGVLSSVILPLSVGGDPLLGALTFDTLREERDWPADIVKRLNLVAQIFSNALIRKKKEGSLRESEERLNLAADSAGTGLWELNFDTNLFWATVRARDIFGYDHDEIVTMERFEQSIHPDDFDRVQKAIAQSLDNREPLSVEYRINNGDNDIKWIHSSGRPYFKTNGEQDRLLGVSIDISERKAFEEHILSSEARLLSAMDIAELGFYEMSEDYRVSFLDNRIRLLFGISPDKEDDGRNFWLAHIHPEDLPRVLEKSRKVLENGVNKFTTDYRYMHPERGLIWLHHQSSVMKRNGEGRALYVIGVVQDITERKQAEDILEESRTALKNSRKDLQQLAGRLISVQEEELRRLSRELHDDLTQKLAVLAIEAGKMEQHLNRMEYSPPELQKISQIKEQLINVSQDVHRISRQLHPTILDDLGLVRAIESECTALQLRENLVILFRKEDIPDTIPNDVSLCIYRVIQEGLKNIINHSGAEKCELYLNCADDTLCLTMKDEGKGFDPTEVRNKPGLGLSSMRERVQLVLGNFSITTRLDQGTFIHVKIPLQKGEP